MQNVANIIGGLILHIIFTASPFWDLKYLLAHILQNKKTEIYVSTGFITLVLFL
jgi:hypothetical protein